MHPDANDKVEPRTDDNKDGAADSRVERGSNAGVEAGYIVMVIGDSEEEA